MTQRQVDLQRLLEMEQQQQYQKEEVIIQNPLAETMKSLEKELNLDIYLDNKDIKKNKKKYSSTKVKARNFLTNASYTGVKNVDHENRSFVIDIFSYLILCFNPYNLDGKFETELEKDYVNILWFHFLPQDFYNFVCQNENIKTLNKTKVKFNDAVKIVKCFIEDETKGLTQAQNFQNLKAYLQKYIMMYQFIFSNLFPKYFSKIDDYSIQTKIEFDSYYKNFLIRKNITEWTNKNNNQYWQKNEEITTLPSLVEVKKEVIDLIDDEKEEKKRKKEEEKI